MRRDRGGRRHAGGRAALVGGGLTGGPSRAVRRSGARGRLRRHLELIHPWFARRSTTPGSARGRRPRRRDAGPGLVGALLVGISAAKAIAWARGIPLVPVDHLQGHVATLYLAPDPFEPPFTCLLASGATRSCSPVRDRTSFEVLGSTLDDAAGEAFDKGARLLGSAIRAAPRSTGSRVGRPRGVPFPRRPRSRARLPFSQASRRRCSTPSASSPKRTSMRGAQISLRPTSARSSRRSSAASRPPPSERATRGWRSSAASPRTRSCALPCRTPGSRPRALHRQRRDDRVRSAVRTTPHNSRLPCPGCVLVRADLTGRPRRCSRSRRSSPAGCSPWAARRGHARRADRRRGLAGLLGSRPLPELGGRWIVVLRAPSLADRVRAGGGRARSDAGLDDGRPRRAAARRSRGSRSAASPFSPSSPTCAY